MSAFLSGLDAAWTFLLSVLSKCFDLYTGTPVFVAVFALWVLDRIFGIFDLIKG